MINFWRAIRYILDLFSYLIFGNEILTEGSDLEGTSARSNRFVKTRTLKVTKSSENDYTDNCSKFLNEQQDSSIITKEREPRGKYPGQNNYDSSISQTRKKKENLSGDNGFGRCDEKITMRRIYARRNSKRFVIGDGEDDIETNLQLPDVTITECNDEQPGNTWSKGNSDGRLSVKPTLT